MKKTTMRGAGAAAGSRVCLRNFFETDTPYGSEFARQKIYVAGFWNTTADWLQKRVTVKN